MTKKTENKRLKYASFTKKQIENFILKWRVYAQVESVSRSWMSRKIWFAVVYKWRFINISREINFMYNWKEKNYWDAVSVWWCWMDMILHVLYTSLPYKEARNWSQRYNRY